MEHLTTLNLPSVHAREADRIKLSAQVALFLATGGVVERLEITARQAEHTGSLRDRPINAHRITGTNRRELEKRDRILAERAKALANARLPGDRIRKKLGLGPVAFEQFIARHGIRLPVLRSTP